MSEQDELATKRSVTLDDLSDRCWVLFERRMHPLVYDNVMDVSQQRKVKPAKVEHIVMPEDAFPFITDNSCVAFTVKAGALRIARNGVTVRPLAEDALLLKTYFASHIENKSKVASELLRAFVRKIESFSGGNSAHARVA
jgi:hypothetical protein